MSLPIVLLLGNHRDPSAYELAKILIPKLAKEGYSRYCLEYPSAWSIEMFRNRMNKTIEFLQRQHGPNTDYIGPFTSTIESMDFAEKHSYCTLFIDDETSINDLAEGLYSFEKSLPTRDTIMADHLYRMHAEKKGIIVPVGPGHYRGIVERLKKKGLSDEDLVCHFPFHYSTDPSQSLPKEHVEAIKKIACRASTEDEIDRLADKILNEVKGKNRLVVELTENSHSQFLSNFFKVNFKAFQRPQYFVDAVLPLDQVREDIKEDLENLSIQHHINEHYLVIPDVNTNEIGHRIRLLPYKV